MWELTLKLIFLKIFFTIIYSERNKKKRKGIKWCTTLLNKLFLMKY